MLFLTHLRNEQWHAPMVWNSATNSEAKTLHLIHWNLCPNVTIVPFFMTTIITRILLIFCSFTRCAAEESNLLRYHSFMFLGGLKYCLSNSDIVAFRFLPWNFRNFFNMKCSMAGFSRPRTVTVRLTSCSYLYLCFCCRGSRDGERKTHQS